MSNKIIGFLLLITISFCCQNVKQKNNLPFANRLKWTEAKIEDKDYSIWGSSPILGEDGKVHVFTARWPEKNIDPAWRKSSEIAHYIADSATGTYKFLDVVVKGSGVPGSWNRYAPHNPEIKKIGDYYALVYIANNDFNQPPHPANQRIGLVYSKSVYGPWQDAGMIIEVSKDSTHWTYGSGLGVDNPTITEVDGKPVIYFKNRKNINGKIVSKYGYATADNLAGPYIMSNSPITNNDSYLEDATSFVWNKEYYLLTTDNHGTLTGITGGGTLWKSKDWKSFNTESIESAYKQIPYYFNLYNSENITKVYGQYPKFERPKVLMIKGEPAYLFAPSGWNVEGGPRTVCYILKIE